MTALWSEEYELNIKDIDAQHRNFLSMLEKIEPILEKGSLDEGDVFFMFRLVMDMRTYSHQHFFTEEKLMIQAGFPDFLDHLILHDEYVSHMNQARHDFLEMFKAFKSGEDNLADILAFSRGQLKFVTAWWQQHISNEDAKYAYFIKTKP